MKELETFFQEHTWLMGKSNVKRAFAIWGYTICAVIMFYAALFVVALGFGAIAGMASWF